MGCWGQTAGKVLTSKLVFQEYKKKKESKNVSTRRYCLVNVPLRQWNDSLKLESENALTETTACPFYNLSF